MGSVLELWEPVLRRPLAQKLIRTTERGGRVPLEGPGYEDALARFFQEAQVTAQLAHPGVVPVHELAMDAEGSVYFTMDRVGGVDLSKAYARLRAGDGTWNAARLVATLLRVCETMAYAHSRGVIHRDLKPANVMVGEFGEVYVMDWGLAKVLGRPAQATGGAGVRASEPVATTRQGESGSDSGSPYLTQEGRTAGTPAYMPPEQAKGQIHLLDARADVYALGAMLYELLAGWPPYDDLDWGGDPQRLVLLVSHMPPTPLAQAAPSAAPELVAICEKAMAREREERYDDMGGMARDLRAWSEGRVVTAYEQGALAELRKWVGRNRGWAVSIVAGVLALLGGVSGMLVVEARGKRQVETERDVTELTSAPQIGRGLMREVDELWPALPALVDRYELWLAQAQALKAQEGFLREGLAALRGEAAGTPFERAQLDAKLQPNLEELLGRWDELAASERRIRARLDFAQGLEGRTRTGAEAQALWARAAADIAQLPPYGGLELEAQLGLLPLRRDPRSGLWEFWHVASGARPELHATGDRWSLEPETGLVLVLIPGGEATVGSVPYAQDDSNSGQPYVDRWHAPAEGPQRQVALDPFFLSKYELTRGQWARSQERAADADGTLPATELSFDASEEAVRRLGLSLPTDPQWEYACRAGTTEPWSFEILGESSTHANGLDVSRLAALGYGAEYIEGFKANWGDYDDGFPELAPAGALLPNPWGLHEIHGNAWEFAREPFTEALGPFDPGEGIQASPSENGLRTLRGGSLGGELSDARSSYRHPYSRKYMDGDTGVRPSRGLVR